MARNYSGVPITPYVGSILPLPKDADPTQYLLPLTFDWVNTLTYFTTTSLGVRVDLTNIEIIERPRWRSVYIDNTQIQYGMELYFPDTGYVVACEPYSDKLAKVYSNANVFILYEIPYGQVGFQGSAGVTNDRNNITFICFDTEDAETTPVTNELRRGSILSPASTQQPPLRIPALGDNIITVQGLLNTAAGTRTNAITFNPLGSPHDLFMLPTLIVTNIFGYFYNSGSAIVNSSSVSLVLHENVPSVDLFTYGTWNAAVQIGDTVTVVNLQDMNIESDPISSPVTLQIINQFNSTIVGSAFQFSIGYTLAH